MLRIGSPGAYSQDPSLWRLKVITNILDVFMRKNLILAGRNFHTSPKSIRGRVMAYLNSVSLQEGSNEFDIPFDRQQLADYLNVERTSKQKRDISASCYLFLHLIQYRAKMYEYKTLLRKP